MIMSWSASSSDVASGAVFSSIILTSFASNSFVSSSSSSSLSPNRASNSNASVSWFFSGGLSMVMSCTAFSSDFSKDFSIVKISLGMADSSFSSILSSNNAFRSTSSSFSCVSVDNSGWSDGLISTIAVLLSSSPLESAPLFVLLSKSDSVSPSMLSSNKASKSRSSPSSLTFSAIFFVLTSASKTAFWSAFFFESAWITALAASCCALFSAFASSNSPTFKSFPPTKVSTTTNESSSEWTSLAAFVDSSFSVRFRSSTSPTYACDPPEESLGDKATSAPSMARFLSLWFALCLPLQIRPRLFLLYTVCLERLGFFRFQRDAVNSKYLSFFVER